MASLQHPRSRGSSVSHAPSSTSFNLYRLLIRELSLDNDDKQHAEHSDRKLIPPLESLEQIRNMAILPLHLETFIAFGLLSCLNSFLKLAVVLPLKLVVDFGLFICAVRDTLINSEAGISRFLRIVNVKNLVFASLIVISILCSNVDTSKIYHTIRAQSSIKLYVMFGVLEVMDKLLSTVGQDLLNYLLAQNPILLVQTRDFAGMGRYTLFYVISAIYLSSHTITLVHETIALNVAANSYSNSLVTLLLSNQFSEIKSSVFKKFDRDGLFQMSCADVVERFQLFIMLSIISLRNMVQIGNSSDDSPGLLPNSTFKSLNRFVGVLLGPTTIVIGSELLVDWIKHSYVTKFNRIRPARVYRKYLDILSTDVIDNFKNNSHFDKIQQRIGVPLPALFVLFIVMSRHSLRWLFYDGDEIILTNVVIGGFVYIVLLLIQLLLELSLLKWSTKLVKKPSTQAHTSSPQKYLFPPASPVVSNKDEQLSPKMNFQDDYVPGLVSGGLGAMDLNSRNLMFDNDEPIPPTINESRALKDARRSTDNVVRYRMSSKQIW